MTREARGARRFESLIYDSERNEPGSWNQEEETHETRGEARRRDQNTDRLWFPETKNRILEEEFVVGRRSYKRLSHPTSQTPTPVSSPGTAGTKAGEVHIAPSPELDDPSSQYRETTLTWSYGGPNRPSPRNSIRMEEHAEASPLRSRPAV